MRKEKVTGSINVIKVLKGGGIWGAVPGDCLFEIRKIAVCSSGFRCRVIIGSLIRLY